MNNRNERRAIVIVESAYKKGKPVFDAVQDFEVISSAADEPSLSARIRDVGAFAVVVGVQRYTGALYEALPPGGLIARFGVGYDNIDFGKVREYGLVVTNTPDVLESTVAEYTVFLAGELLRRPGRFSEQMHAGVWGSGLGSELRGKTWAVIGLGKIGKALARILSFGFGMRVVCMARTPYDAAVKRAYGIDLVSPEFAEVAADADIVSLHLPVNTANAGFMNRDRLGLMKKGVVLVNTGRGALVDEDALYDALSSGYVAAAGLDVFAEEPYRPASPNKDLRDLSNVVMTPHIASSTVECAERMAKRVMQNVRYAAESKTASMDIVRD